MKIGSIQVGIGHAPVVIAEMSGNHNQSIDRALEIVEAAASSGAHMLKLQTYTPDTITLEIDHDEFFISNKDSLWNGRSLHDLYGDAHTPWEWHEQIIAKATDLGMVCFSSPFDHTAVDFLEQLDVPAYKIASFENVDLRLIKKIASTGKPVILSTGMASISELGEAVRTIREAGCDDFALLKCTSTYPALPTDSNLSTIPHMRELFDCEVGLSDHTMGLGTAVAAVALGATLIEKHFTLNRADGGVDSEFSLEPHEMSQLVIETKRAWQSLGTVRYGPTEAEKDSLVFRRSLYVSEDMKNGDKLNENNLRSIRPGLGLQPRFYDIVLGRQVNRDVPRGTALSWDLIL